MSQSDVLEWLIAQRRKNPNAVFRISEIARGIGGCDSNTKKQVDKLCKHGLIEIIDLKKEHQRRFRVSTLTFERATGLVLGEILVI